MPYVKAILIGCEGTTERKYFQYLQRMYRIDTFPLVKVYGNLKQHTTLIDNVISKRDEFVKEFGYDPHMIECWAVTDADEMPCTYQELVEYAKEHSVQLAFSDPQFECFMLQHHSPSRLTKQSELYAELTKIKAESGNHEPYNDSTKGDIDFLLDAIDKNPNIVTMAIKNANQRSSRLHRPFLTVQRLAERFEAIYRGY